MRFDRTHTQRWFGYALVVLAIIALVLLVRPVMSVLVLAALTAYFSRPVYLWLRGAPRLPRWSALPLTWIIVGFGVLIPLMFALGYALDQISELLVNASSRIDLQSLDAYQVIDNINATLKNIPFGEYQIDMQFIQQKIGQLTSWLGSKASGTIKAVGGGIGNGIANLILYIVVTSGLLIHRKQLGTYLKQTLPLDPKVLELYRVHLIGMGSSMARATVIIAFVQAVITGISFAIVGIKYPVLWTLLAFLLSVIPMVGSAFVVVPVALVLMFMGKIGAGLLLIAINILITNTIDNILRPKLVSKEAQINETMLLVSVFGGMGLFGIWGILYGPVLMSFILVTFEAYRTHRV